MVFWEAVPGTRSAGTRQNSKPTVSDLYFNFVHLGWVSRGETR